MMIATIPPLGRSKAPVDVPAAPAAAPDSPVEESLGADPPDAASPGACAATKAGVARHSTSAARTDDVSMTELALAAGARPSDRMGVVETSVEDDIVGTEADEESRSLAEVSGYVGQMAVLITAAKWAFLCSYDDNGRDTTAGVRMYCETRRKGDRNEDQTAPAKRWNNNDEQRREGHRPHKNIGNEKTKVARGGGSTIDISLSLSLAVAALEQPQRSISTCQWTDDIFGPGECACHCLPNLVRRSPQCLPPLLHSCPLQRNSNATPSCRTKM